MITKQLWVSSHNSWFVQNGCCGCCSSAPLRCNLICYQSTYTEAKKAPPDATSNRCLRVTQAFSRMQLEQVWLDNICFILAHNSLIKVLTTLTNLIHIWDCLIEALKGDTCQLKTESCPSQDDKKKRSFRDCNVQSRSSVLDMLNSSSDIL